MLGLCFFADLFKFHHDSCMFALHDYHCQFLGKCLAVAFPNHQRRPLTCSHRSVVPCEGESDQSPLTALVLHELVQFSTKFGRAPTTKITGPVIYLPPIFGHKCP